MTFALCAGDVGVALAGGTRVLDAKSLPVTAREGAAPWEGALDAVDTWLGDGKRKRRRARATVSAAFTRLCCVPWTDRRLSPEQDGAWVRLQLEQAFGDMDGWTVQAELGRYGQPRLACALPADLVSRWHAICRARRLSCASLVPYAVVAWNRWRRLARPGQLWAIAETDRVVWSLRGPTGWDSVGMASQRVSADVLPRLAEREQRLRGAGAAGPIVFHAPGLMASSSTEGVQWLCASLDLEPMSVAMARTAVGA
ncbi:hypothetical protein [Pseudorhodoferax sp. Leaf265]|uniref:hypothetical protein n=1 Tax=Pseudorhodoferax sp. Leaf265 TaxID=1736315 RepID=UPI0006F25168|nr:hypothetical protein [Pseudorhodoferax sp. Leaf265]KQP17027.1 hypothetical protein ASF45_27805 [Pseudorhodoferax sp. Leaf265]